MNQFNNRLEMRLVAVDSDYLSVTNDHVQNLPHDSEHLSMAISTIKPDDGASRGVIMAVRSALLANSKMPSIVSEMMKRLILLPELEVSSHE